jgi:DNA-binding HxlR family transcriptional regulator
MQVGDERYLRGLYDLKYLFGDKWVPAIMVTLSGGPMRRKEILSTISSYSIGEEWSDKHAVLHDSILARTLKKMTEEGLLTRTRRTEAFPVTVTYSLKPEVLEFLKLAEPVIAWVDDHPELVGQAQAYSRRNGDEVGALTGVDELDDNTLAEVDDE